MQHLSRDHRRGARGLLALPLLMGTAAQLPAQPATMVLDINPGATSTNPGKLVALGSTLFFVASQPGTGLELWKTDGTTAGTQLVKDINPGAASSSPQFLTPFGGAVFFRAYEPSTGYELWKSDGTSAGTVLVTETTPGPAGNALHLIVVGDRLFFDDGITASNSLWTTDGTAAGTERVGFRIDGLGYRAAVGDIMFFDQESEYGNELWQTDGTLAGTRPTLGVRSVLQSPQGFWTTSRLVYWTGFDLMGNPDGLWRSDGTVNGTFRLFGGSLVFRAAAVNDTLYFVPFNALPFALWKTDGTEAGTVHVKDLPGEASTIASAGNRLFFTLGSELWVSDGTEVGTAQVRAFTAAVPQPHGITSVGNASVMFSANDGSNGLEPWFSDGTAAGTTMVQDIAAGAAGSAPQSFTVAGSNVFFTADDGVAGRELWVLPNVVTEPPLLVETLMVDVVILNLQNGILNSLDAKLDSALQALVDVHQANNMSALNSLNAFINAVQAQSGNHIPASDADALIAQAQAIMAQLGQ
ncbi:MAG: hypothetical protein R3F56_01335 [Planctomycetota bacterium]